MKKGIVIRVGGVALSALAIAAVCSINNQQKTQIIEDDVVAAEKILASFTTNKEHHEAIVNYPAYKAYMEEQDDLKNQNELGEEDLNNEILYTQEELDFPEAYFDAEQETTQNNPFQNLAGQTNAGRHSDNTADLEQSEETTGSLDKDAEEKTDKTEEGYNGESGANAGNTETGTTTETAANIPNITRSGVPTQNYVHGALATAVGLTIFALLIKKLAQHGISPTTTQRRRETKLNAQSKKYFAVKSQYKKQSNFMQSSEKKETKIAKDIKKVEEKIGKGKLSNKNNVNLVRAFSKGSKNKKYYNNNLVGNAVYTKDSLKKHRSAIKDEATIASLSSKKQTKARSEKINKIRKKQDEKMQKVSLGLTDSSIHYAAKLPNMYSDMSAVGNKNVNPLYIHRAITDFDDLNLILDRAHKVLPYADKKVRVCKINIYNTEGELTTTLGGSFDNEIGYKVVKAALLKKVKELKKECSDLDKVDVKESATGGKTEQNNKTYILNVDDAENNIGEFTEELNKADVTLKKFDSLYTKTKLSQDQSL